MSDSGRRSHAYENAVLNLVEARRCTVGWGSSFEGVVLEVEHDDERKGTVMIREPAVEAPVTSRSPLPVGEDVTVTLAEADPTTRKVRFTALRGPILAGRMGWPGDRVGGNDVEEGPGSTGQGGG